MSDKTIRALAEEEFGEAALGDSRRTDRLVLMTERAFAAPSGLVSSVFQERAELHGAYDFLENDLVAPEEIAASLHAATARRAIGEPYVVVATDGSSITVTDTQKQRGTGPIGTHKAKARGDKVHSALALTKEGIPLGLLAQSWWVRSGRKTAPTRKTKKTAQKETIHWLDVREAARAVLQREAPGVSCWFQHDREADAWPILADMVLPREGEATTVRAAWDRRLWQEEPGEEEATSTLREALAKTPLLGFDALELPAGPRRQARFAQLEIRATTVTLRLRDKRTGALQPARLTVVCAREVGTVPRGEKPLEWLLLTTWSVQTIEDALLVVRTYAMRWRIEDFHKAWKSAQCDVESMQLHAHDHRVKWALILAAVATRTVRLIYLARREPERPATEEFSQQELEAVRDLTAKRPLPKNAVLKVAEVVWAIAVLGGYAGTSWDNPPGYKTLARGLRRVLNYAEGLRGRALRRKLEKEQQDPTPADGPDEVNR
jgi:hypothetical protein